MKLLACIENRLSQTIRVSLKSGTGFEELKLGPNESSAAVPAESITEYTRQLEARGTVRIVNLGEAPAEPAAEAVAVQAQPKVSPEPVIVVDAPTEEEQSEGHDDEHGNA